MSEEVDRAVAGLSTALDELAGLDWTAVPADALLTVLDHLEAARRRVPVVEHAVIAQVEQRHVAFDLGANDTATLLVQRLHLSRSAAKRRVLDARDLGPDPVFPRLAAAQTADEVSEEHAGVVIKAIDALPGDHPDDVEARLVARARTDSPDQLRLYARDLKDRLDPDDATQRAADHQRRRDVTLRRHADGSADLTGHLTPEAGIKWQVLLSAMSAPKPAVDGTADARTAAQRRHDGMLDIADKILDTGSLPDCGGTPVTLIITATADQVSRPEGLATTEHGAHIDMNLALQLAESCDNYLSFTDITGQLHLGRNKRLAQPAMRRALAIRDGGCSFPDCNTPSSWTQAHHVTDWKAGGHTDINNMTLVCGYHHREHQRLGWTCHIKDNSAWWTPPDGTAPRRNESRHLPNDEYTAPPNATGAAA